jgi:hypothetical protein
MIPRHEVGNMRIPTQMFASAEPDASFPGIRSRPKVTRKQPAQG